MQKILNNFFAKNIGLIWRLAEKIASRNYSPDLSHPISL